MKVPLPRAGDSGGTGSGPGATTPPGPRTGSISADFDDLSALAGVLRELATALDEAVAATVATSHSALLAASALADPLAAARLEVALVDVRDGPAGMRWAALELTGLAALLTLAVECYRTADGAAAALAPHHLLGIAQDLLARHGWAVDDLIGIISGAVGLPESRIAAALAVFYPDGRPQVRLVARPPGGAPPRSISDLMASLQRRCGISDRWSPADPAAVKKLPSGYDDGTIDVRRLTGPDGTAWVVDLPGTSDWDLLPVPWSRPPRAHDPADWGGNLRLMAGESTAYERGVLTAMTAAGVRPGEPVLLTGHSQGGMVAMGLAGMLTARGVDVRSVLTAGSPIAGMPRPPATSVLSLENSDDLVPHLDGAANPETPGWTTLRFTDDVGTITGNHGFTAYDAGARLADRSTQPAVRRWRQRARPFLTATSTESWAFRIQRVP